MQTVGEILRSERERKGLSVKEIELATSIRTIYITAIEEGNYTIIPGEVYLKGFIRNYANFLDLDSQQIVDLYRQSQNPVAPTNERITSIDNAPKEKPLKEANKSSKWLVIGVLVVGVASGALWFQNNSSSLPPEPRADRQVQQPAPVIPKQAVIPSTPVTMKPVVIIAKYTDQCWTSVTADNKIIYEGTPQAGETFTWEAEQNITIKAGNAGGIDIVYNGQSLGILGTKGEVLVRTFSAKK
ncbi:MAG: putative transcriptional regulator [Pelosinus sp.]|nr:putative transcriptional regulator [Pelosinus sp.]